MWKILQGEKKRISKYFSPWTVLRQICFAVQRFASVHTAMNGYSVAVVELNSY